MKTTIFMKYIENGCILIVAAADIADETAGQRDERNTEAVIHRKYQPQL